MINTVAVKKRMIDMGMSNNDIAEKANTSKSYMSSVINGKKSLSLRMAKKLQHALQISNEEFMFYFMHSE